MQSTLYPSMYRLLRGEEPGPPAEAATLAEGIAVKEPGRLTRRIVEALVSDILLVDEAMLEDAVEILLDRQKLVVEGAGAAGARRDARRAPSGLPAGGSGSSSPAAISTCACWPRS